MVHFAAQNTQPGAERAVVGLPCTECGGTTHVLGNGRRAYPHRPDLYSKSFWFCACGAFVGCHPGTTNALGSPAGKVTKWARSAAHAAFDPIWKGRQMSRSEAYRWLADALGIEPRDCHISQMDGDLARRAAAVCKARTASSVGIAAGDEPNNPARKAPANER